MTRQMPTPPRVSCDPSWVLAAAYSVRARASGLLSRFCMRQASGDRLCQCRPKPTSTHENLLNYNSDIYIYKQAPTGRKELVEMNFLKFDFGPIFGPSELVSQIIQKQ